MGNLLFRGNKGKTLCWDKWVVDLFCNEYPTDKRGTSEHIGVLWKGEGIKEDVNIDLKKEQGDE